MDDLLVEDDFKVIDEETEMMQVSQGFPLKRRSKAGDPS